MKTFIAYCTIILCLFQDIGIAGDMLAPRSIMSPRGDGHDTFSWKTRDVLIRQLKDHSLPSKVFDLIVLGGGVAGAQVAREAAANGLRVLIVDPGDWGMKTSANATNVLHSGVMYLERTLSSLKKGKLREAWQNWKRANGMLRERDLLTRGTSAISKPKTVHLVLERKDSRSPYIVYAGLLVIWAMGGFRGGMPNLYIRPSTLKKQFPELKTEDVKGIVAFNEVMTDGRLLALYSVKDAFLKGAVTVNYLLPEKIQFLQKGEGEYTVSLRDLIGDSRSPIVVRGKCLVNAAGGDGIDRVNRLLQDPVVQEEIESNQSENGLLMEPVYGGHLIVPAKLLNSKQSFLFKLPIGLNGEERNVFAIYRNEGQSDEDGYFLIDATEWLAKDGQQPSDLAEKAFSLILEAINRQFPEAHLTRADVHTQFAKKPVPYIEGQSPQDTIRTHLTLSSRGRYSVMRGVTLSSSRLAAIELLQSLGIHSKESPFLLPIPLDVHRLSAQDVADQQMVFADPNNRSGGPGGVLSSRHSYQLHPSEWLSAA
jgi:glycerol-3-phosphate dehydrogenase